MSENKPKKKLYSKLSWKYLRLSLKYRPDLFKLILKMRQSIRKKNSLLKSLKKQLKQLESKINESKNDTTIDSSNPTISCEQGQEGNKPNPDNSNKQEEASRSNAAENAGWCLTDSGDTAKSIAEQVKEVAQNALQDTGMVYVESAGMFYDYKTGYYYNSELGLYYHTKTGCYYYYSDDKQFVFHSYPDMSNVNTSLIAHQNKKAKKLKRERNPEDDIENLTKHLSQDNEDGGKPKKSRKSKPKKEKSDKKTKKSKEEKKKNAKETMDISDKKQEEKHEDHEDLDKKESDQPINVHEKDNSKENKINLDSDMFEPDNPEEKTKTAVITEDNIDKDDHEIQNAVKNEPDEVMPEALEDGECSDTESEDSDSDSDASTSSISDEDSVAKHHPPCMRVIVRETKLSKLKVGSLFLITKDGGTVGREGDNHAILLKDHNVSRNHLDIRYDMARKTYVATDLGSKNGSVLNGVRMSESQEHSAPRDILHGSTLQLGETKLLCHIHPGHATCGQCEPGLLMQAEEEKKAAYTRTVSVKKQYELELARLKNIYAPQRLAIEERPYNDRAQARRDAVGSTNHAEKTQASDLDTSIAPDNKGFKLLQKMGWSKGEGLGKDSQGDTEPVPLISNEGKAGLGTTGAVAPPSNTPKPRVINNNIASGTMRLAARTNMLKPPAKAFQNDDDEESE